MSGRAENRNIPFEVTDHPWFGPKRRARRMLRLRTSILSPSRALRVMAQMLAPLSADIQRVRFIDYADKERSGYRFTIALVWTSSSYALRQALYDKADEIVRATGWYPVPAGERIGSGLALTEFRDLLGGGGNVCVGLDGELHSFENAVGMEGGCSIRVRMDQDAILLDTGFPGQLSVRSEDKIALLSHFHFDHSGGLSESLSRGLPVVMSEVTAQMLLALGRITVAELKKVTTLEFNRPMRLDDHVSVIAFQVPHCPGSAGYLITAGDDLVVYSGDIVLRTARHNYSPDLSKQILQAGKRRNWLLLDATMVGRSGGATLANASQLLLAEAGEYTDIVIVSDSAEHLLYAYLDLYDHTRHNRARRWNTAYLLSGGARELFQALHAAFIERRVDQLDPLLWAQYRTSMAAWAESRWLYWLDRDEPWRDIPKNHLRLWLIEKHDLPMVHPIGKAAIVTLGRTRVRDSDLGFEPHWLDLDLDAWTLHSDEDSLRDGVNEFANVASVILFHNYPKRIRRFTKRTGLQCSALRGTVLAK